MGFSLSSLFNPFSSGSPLSALGGEYGLLSNPTGAWDKFKNGDTNEVNMDIANKNYDLQKENLEYQKALQQKIFDREDSSYARTVQDMRNAGISPLMMSGTNGAGEAIQTSAPQYDYQHTDIGALQVLGDVLSTVQQLRMNQTQIEKQNIENRVASATADSRINFQKGLEILQSYDRLDAQMKVDFNNFFGTHSGMSEKERLGMILRKALIGNSDTYIFGRHGVYSDLAQGLNSAFDYKSNMDFSKAINVLVEDYLNDKDKKSQGKINLRSSMFGKDGVISTLLQSILGK